MQYSFTWSKAVTSYRNYSGHCGGYDDDKCAQVQDKYFDVKKNVHKERHNFLSTSPEGGETIDNFIVRLKKNVNTVSVRMEQDDNQIRDRVFYFIQDKALKRTLYR